MSACDGFQQSYLACTAVLLTYPIWHAVIKPIYGAASIGVVRVNDMQQLEAAYKRVTRELARAHIVAGALEQGEEDEVDAAGNAIETTTAHVGSQNQTPHSVPPSGMPDVNPHPISEP